MTRLYDVLEIHGRFSDPPPTWHRAEQVIRRKYGLVEDHGPAHDALTRSDTPVEIKSCATEYSDGRPGQFEIWERQLYELLPDGQVALLVYQPDGMCSIIATRMVDAADLEFAGTASLTRHPTMGRAYRRRVPWPEVIPLDTVRFYWRGTYAEYFDPEEVEGAILPIFRGSGTEDS